MFASLLKYENSRREAVVMNSVLIAGVESVAGGNLAAVLQKSFQVTGVTLRSGIQIENCRILKSQANDLAGIQQLIRSERPDWIVALTDEPGIEEAAIKEALAYYASATRELRREHA